MLARLGREHKTQEAYIRAVRNLAGFLGRSPDTATVEDLRRFQLHLVDRGTSPITLNATLTGLKFFFDVTLDRGELMAKMQPVRVPRTLPVVLSREEVARLIAAAPNLKSHTALSVAYGAGLRASEVIALKVGDIDSQRMTLRVEQGKGRKDRYAMLSPVLLERLRAWWRVGHAQGKILPNGWLFPGLNPMDPLTTRQLNPRHPCRRLRGENRQARDAHPAPQLRHHLLERKVDIVARASLRIRSPILTNLIRIGACAQCAIQPEQDLQRTYSCKPVARLRAVRSSQVSHFLRSSFAVRQNATRTNVNNCLVGKTRSTTPGVGRVSGPATGNAPRHDLASHRR